MDAAPADPSHWRWSCCDGVCTVREPGEQIGLIGVGLLGSALADRLLLAGFRVLGCDKNPARRAELEARGGEVVDQPAEVFSAATRVVLCLPTLNDSLAVLSEPSLRMSPGQIIVDTTTGAPEMSLAIAKVAEQMGADYLDATISGSSQQVRDGQGALFVGASPTGFAICEDLLICIGKSVTHAGPVGAGSKLKLVTNLVLGLNRAALAEGLVLAQRLGLDAPATLAALKQSAAYSAAMDAKGEKMIRRDFHPQARLAQHLKDVQLLRGAAEPLQLPLTNVHASLLEWAQSQGLGELDNSAVLVALEEFARRPTP